MICNYMFKEESKGQQVTNPYNARQRQEGLQLGRYHSSSIDLRFQSQIYRGNQHIVSLNYE